VAEAKPERQRRQHDGNESDCFEEHNDPLVIPDRVREAHRAIRNPAQDSWQSHPGFRLSPE